MSEDTIMPLRDLLLRIESKLDHDRDEARRRFATIELRLGVIEDRLTMVERRAAGLESRLDLGEMRFNHVENRHICSSCRLNPGKPSNGNS